MSIWRGASGDVFGWGFGGLSPPKSINFKVNGFGWTSCVSSPSDVFCGVDCMRTSRTFPAMGSAELPPPPPSLLSWQLQRVMTEIVVAPVHATYIESRRLPQRMCQRSRTGLVERNALSPSSPILHAPFPHKVRRYFARSERRRSSTDAAQGGKAPPPFAAPGPASRNGSPRHVSATRH